MNANQRLQGEVIRLGLLAGFTPVGEAVAWADHMIEAEDTPHPSVLEVALASNRTPKQAAALLSEVPGPVDQAGATRRFLARLLQALRSDRKQLRHVIKLLYQLRVEGEIPEAEYGSEPWIFEDEFDLAESQLFGTIAEVAERVEAYLSRHADPAEA